MSNAWDEREKALEGEYFRRRDQELIAKLKAKITAEQKTQNYKCPKCDGSLSTGNFENIQVEICDKCGGVWLDAGELQLIVNQGEDGWFKRLLG